MQENATNSIKYVADWVCDLINEPYDYYAITGGLGSAKTTGCAVAMLYTIINNPKVPLWWAVALTHTRADDTLLPAYVFALVDIFGLKNDLHFKIVRSKPIEIRFKHSGQVLALHSGDRPENMVGTNIGGYHISEAGSQKREVWEKCTARARDKRASRILRILEGTPEGDGYYREEFDIDRVDKEKSYRRFTLHTDDNIHNLADNYIQQLERVYDATRLKSYRFGLFTSFNTGDVFENYLESRNVAKENIRPDPNLPIDLCFDFNRTPMTWSAWQNMPFANGSQRIRKEVCVQESSLDHSGLMKSAIDFGLKFDPKVYRNTPINIYGDRTGHAGSHKVEGTDFTNLKKYLDESFSNVTIRAAREVTPIRASVDVMNRMFLYDRAIISPNCVHMRSGLRGCKWIDGKAQIDKPSGDKVTHLPDGARYRFYAKYRNTDFSNVDNINQAMGMNW
jgi:hypothetical protein